MYSKIIITTYIIKFQIQKVIYLYFFAKIHDPWGNKLIDTYYPGTTDTLGKRITHVRDKLSEWC